MKKKLKLKKKKKELINAYNGPSPSIKDKQFY